MTKFDPQKHDRRSLRLKDYDYSQAGAYFITIAVQNRKYLFGDIVKGELILNEVGKMIDEQWSKLPTRFSNMELDFYQIMPNHFHGIISIVAATLVVAPSPMVNHDMQMGNLQKIKANTGSPTLGDIVGAFKSITTNEYIKGVYDKNWPRFDKRLWQRNYYEHVIRSEADLNRIRAYIQSNPDKWDGDKDKFGPH